MIAAVPRHLSKSSETYRSSLPPTFPHLDRRATDPYKRLMAAVLETVLDDFRGSPYRRNAGLGPVVDVVKAKRAVAYVQSTDRDWPFSFENLCEALDLDATCLRRALQQPSDT